MHSPFKGLACSPLRSFCFWSTGIIMVRCHFLMTQQELNAGCLVWVHCLNHKDELKYTIQIKKQQTFGWYGSYASFIEYKFFAGCNCQRAQTHCWSRFSQKSSNSSSSMTVKPPSQSAAFTWWQHPSVRLFVCGLKRVLVAAGAYHVGHSDDIDFLLHVIAADAAASCRVTANIITACYWWGASCHDDASSAVVIQQRWDDVSGQHWSINDRTWHSHWWWTWRQY